jgi:hypothetical protein
MATAPPAPKALATSGERSGGHAGGTVNLQDQVRDALVAAGLATSELLVTRADGPSDATSVRVVGDGVDFVVHAAPATEERRYFRRRDDLVAWYRATSPVAPALNVIETACDALLDAVASMPRAPDDALPEQLALPRRSLLDAVRCGVKPAASMLVDLKRFDPRTLGDDLSYVLSAQGFDTSETGDIRIDWAPARDDGRRMLYVGLDRSALEAMRDTEAALYATRDGSGSGDTGELQRRFGEAMGYPACCTRAFVARLDNGGGAADYYTATGALGLNGAQTPWWANHAVAFLSCFTSRARRGAKRHVRVSSAPSRRSMTKANVRSSDGRSPWAP